MPLWELTVAALRTGYRRKEFSPLDVIDQLLARIESLDRRVGAFRQVLVDSSRQEAARLSEDLARGSDRGPLHGIPVAIKELIDVRGARGCYGSQVFVDRISPGDSAVVERLRGAGAIVIGITRSHEFGWGITTQHRLLGSTRNPWNLERVPGGSSGGSAAALASRMVPLALGTDTGGSVRIPAAFCGVAAVKPTYGAISKRGVVPLAPSLDHVGPMARTVEDLALALEVLAGFDPDDPASRRRPLPPLSGVAGDRIDGIRVGTAPSLHLTPLAPDYEEVFSRALLRGNEAGAEIMQIDLVNAERIRPVFSVVQMAEAYQTHSSVLGTFPSRALEYGDDVRGRLETAAHATMSDYLEAHTETERIRRHFEAAFERVDVILTPVSAGPASRVSDPDQTIHLGRSVPFRDLVMDYTVPQNLCGLPACVVPAGFDADHLPVGVQVTAPAGREDLALRVAAVLQDRLAVGPVEPPTNS